MNRQAKSDWRGRVWGAYGKKVSFFARSCPFTDTKNTGTDIKGNDRGLVDTRLLHLAAGQESACPSRFSSHSRAQRGPRALSHFGRWEKNNPPFFFWLGSAIPNRSTGEMPLQISQDRRAPLPEGRVHVMYRSSSHRKRFSYKAEW